MTARVSSERGVRGEMNPLSPVAGRLWRSSRTLVGSARAPGPLEFARWMGQFSLPIPWQGSEFIPYESRFHNG
jgi:hypothetical protein